MKGVLRDVVDALKDMEVESNREDAAGAEGTSRTALPAVRLHRRLNDVVDGGVRPRLALAPARPER